MSVGAAAVDPGTEAGPVAEWRRWALAPPGAHGAVLATATLKDSAADFVVSERLGFAPDGGGAHLLLEVRKSGCDTLQVARALARHAGCAPRDVGFAGLKDRIALATQWFSVPAQRPAGDWHGHAGPGFEVRLAAPHSRKLRRGALVGNDFRIVLRDCTVEAAALATRLAAIAGRGVPNYFGPQRFGRDGGNLDAVAHWCGTGRLPAGREPRAFVISAARALCFNALLAERVAMGSWDRLLPGEFVNLDGRNSYFVAADIDAALVARLERHDLHPTGPLAGRGPVPESAAGALEKEVLDGFARLRARLETAGVEAARRALRVRPQGLRGECAGGQLTLEFGLPAGAYATAVVREIAATRATRAEVEDA